VDIQFYEPFTMRIDSDRDTNGMRWSGGKLTTGVASLCDPEQMKHYTVHHWSSLLSNAPRARALSHLMQLQNTIYVEHGQIHLNSCTAVLIALQWSDTIRAN